jgi:hypothetical protein
LQSLKIAGFYLLHLIVSIIHKSLHLTISNIFMLVQLPIPSWPTFVAPLLFRFALTSIPCSPLQRLSPVAVTRYKLCKLHWSLSFQYSRWSIGFFHRVFAFVSVEPNILSSHFIRVVPSCFCQTVTIPFVCVNRGLLLQDLGVSIANGLALVKVSSPAARLHGNSILRKDVSLNGLEAWHQKNLINSSCSEIGFLSSMVF